MAYLTTPNNPHYGEFGNGVFQGFDRNIYKVAVTTSSQVAKMDTSRKILHEDILLLDEIEMKLKKKGEKTTQKELIHKAIVQLAEGEGLVKKPSRKKDNTPEMVDMLLANAGKLDFGKNWMEEIDTTL